MPSDKPDDDMNDPAFSPRQLKQLDEKLDERFESCGFNARQLHQLDVILEEKLEQKLEQKLGPLFARLADELRNAVSTAVGVYVEHLDARMEAALADSRRALAEDFARIMKAANEDLPVRVTGLADHVAKLDVRVTKLEAVSPPDPGTSTAGPSAAPRRAKPQRRRRG